MVNTKPEACWYGRKLEAYATAHYRRQDNSRYPPAASQRISVLAEKRRFTLTLTLSSREREQPVSSSVHLKYGAVVRLRCAS
jgi:hypothetical protein